MNSCPVPCFTAQRRSMFSRKSPLWHASPLRGEAWHPTPRVLPWIFRKGDEEDDMNEEGLLAVWCGRNAGKAWIRRMRLSHVGYQREGKRPGKKLRTLPAGSRESDKRSLRWPTDLTEPQDVPLETAMSQRTERPRRTDVPAKAGACGGVAASSWVARRSRERDRDSGIMGLGLGSEI